MNAATNKIEYWLVKNMICIPNKTKKIEDNDIEEFILKHKKIIDDVIQYMPRGMSTVGAAVAKCAIQYDQDRAINFLKNSKDKIFQGKEDPVYHFYLWLHGLKGPKRKKNDISTYEITYYACKQYCLNKKIKRLSKSKDNMSWQKDWTLKSNSKSPDYDIVSEFITKLKEQNISTNDFIAALKKQEKS